MADETEKKTELDFDIIKENWNIFKLKDGTLLKVRVGPLKIFRTEKVAGPFGYPSFEIGSINIITAKVPSNLRGSPTDEEIKPADIEEEFNYPGDIELVKEEWQEYQTEDKFLVKIKPMVAKAARTKKYNKFGEPIYLVHVQATLNVEKVP